MHDITPGPPDPLDDLLRPPPAGDAAALRQRVFDRTRRVLRRRRLVRRLAHAAALLLSFAAGAGAMRWADLPAGSASKGSVGEVVEQRGADAPRSPVSAQQREEKALDSESHRRELYRQAGDAYLAEDNDVESALRCFRIALDDGDEKNLEISPEDNWLLMALKNARQKEKKHATNDY